MLCICHNNRTFANAITQCALFMFWTGDKLPYFAASSVGSDVLSTTPRHRQDSDKV